MKLNYDVNLLKTLRFREVEASKLNPETYPATWFYCKEVRRDITFNITIEVLPPHNFRIDVLDENFCQPFDYQYMLHNNPTAKIPLEVKSKVEEQMQILVDAGLITEYTKGDYI